MKGKTNASGRGTFIGNDAVLRVQAPAGSIVTISKGNITKTDHGHLNSTDFSVYDYYFMIHASQFDSTNSWTVIGTLNDLSDSKTIIIDQADEYDLVLRYKLYLHRGLDQCVDATGGWESIGTGWNGNYTGSQALTVTNLTNPDGVELTQGGSSKGGSYKTINTIDLTDYATLKFSGIISTQTNDNVQLQIATNPTGYIQQPANYAARYVPAANTVKTHTNETLIDVSSLVGSYYIRFCIYASASRYFDIYNLYLDPYGGENI